MAADNQTTIAGNLVEDPELSWMRRGYRRHRGRGL